MHDIITRAGGLTPNAFAFGSLFTRGENSIQIDLEKLLDKPKSKNNITLQEGDKIFIANKPDVVLIEGEVHSPGFTNIKGQRLKDYLNSSGGLTPSADKTRYTLTMQMDHLKLVIQYSEITRY